MGWVCVDRRVRAVRARTMAVLVIRLFVPLMSASINAGVTRQGTIIGPPYRWRHLSVVAVTAATNLIAACVSLTCLFQSHVRRDFELQFFILVRLHP